MSAGRRNSRVRSSVTFASLLLAAIQGSPVQAGEAANQASGVTWHVANNGVDSPDCGSRRSPCRTISQGIVNSAEGDLVLVGPGLYGDLNRSCTFHAAPEEGEEFGNTFCNVEVRVCLNKAVTVASVEGAEATVLDVCGFSFGVVVLASNATFGRPHRGFTLINADSNAVAVAAPSNVTISGNIASAPRPSNGCNGCNGFSIQEGTDHRLVGNLARDVDAGFLTFTTGGLRMIGNVALNNSLGFGIFDQDTLIAGNLAIGNNLGFQVRGNGHTFRGNSAIGNRNYGIWLLGAAIDDIDITRNNIFGNNNVPQDGNVNCGLVNQTNSIVSATNNFWGAPTGPGTDPADEACDLEGGQIIHTPFAKKQFPLRKRDFSRSTSGDVVEADVRAQ